VDKYWKAWKHALGSFDEEDGYDAADEDKIALIRTIIVLSNLTCAYLIMANIIWEWIK
jgi:hypothetical protein|tara:strand:- start:235 stop:408 length:174 start_codon:yes stop_codon:yes gene_type:complete